MGCMKLWSAVFNHRKVTAAMGLDCIIGGVVSAHSRRERFVKEEKQGEVGLPVLDKRALSAAADLLAPAIIAPVLGTLES